MRLSLLNGWASSSVGRHSERWIALGSVGMITGHGRQDNSALASHPRTVSRRGSSLPLLLPSIMNQQQQAPHSQPGASLYMGQRLEMEYLCAGTHTPFSFCVPWPKTFLQIVAQRTRSDLVNRSVAESVATESCTRNGRREASVSVSSILAVANLPSLPPSHFPEIP